MVFMLTDIDDLQLVQLVKSIIYECNTHTYNNLITNGGVGCINHSVMLTLKYRHTLIKTHDFVMLFKSHY